MALKTYKCMNVGNGCVNADTGKTFDLADLGNPACPECGTTTIIPVKQGRPVAPIAVAALILVGVGGLSGLGYYFWPGRESRDPVAKQVQRKSPPQTTCDMKAMETAYRSNDCATVVKLGDQCLAQLPDDATVLNNVATCLLRDGDARRAGDLLQRAVVLKPSDPYLRYNQACVAARTDKKDEAVEHLRKACQLGLAPANFRQDPDLASLAGHASFEDMVVNKKCQ